MSAARRGLLFTVSGPSGAGKSTLLRRLFQEDPLVRFSVSMTTRPPRPDEREGIDYLFVSQEVFRAARERGQFLEWAEVHGHEYGTPLEPVEQQLEQGFDVVLDIDVQGAQQVYAHQLGSVFVFIYPPSWEALEQRLRARGTEAPEELALRLRDARWELQQASWFDYLVLNDGLDVAYQHFRAIFLAERCRRRSDVEAAYRERFQ